MSRCGSCKSKLPRSAYFYGRCQCKVCGNKNIENPVHRIVWTIGFMLVGFIFGVFELGLRQFLVTVFVMVIMYFFTKSFKISGQDS